MSKKYGACQVVIGVLRISIEWPEPVEIEISYINLYENETCYGKCRYKFSHLEKYYFETK